MNSKVDFYFNKASKWQAEVIHLRQLVLDCLLTEELKWGKPCYTLHRIKAKNQVDNILLIHTFKDYCAILFFKGALLKDANGLLKQQTANVQAARQMRFTNLHEIIKLEKTIKAYIHEAIEIEKAGLTVKLKKVAEYAISEAFQKQLVKNKALNNAFYTLTPGRQRAYLLFFSASKQTKTQEARVKKCMPQILNGIGLND